MFSAVHPTTDIAKILRHVRFVPLPDSCTAANRTLPGLQPFTLHVTGPLSSISWLPPAAPDLFSKRTRPVAAIHYRNRSDSFQSRHKAGRVIGGWQWRAADRRCASRCGHSSRGASGLGVAFVGALPLCDPDGRGDFGKGGFLHVIFAFLRCPPEQSVRSCPRYPKNIFRRARASVLDFVNTWGSAAVWVS